MVIACVEVFKSLMESEKILSIGPTWTRAVVDLLCNLGIGCRTEMGKIVWGGDVHQRLCRSCRAEKTDGCLKSLVPVLLAKIQVFQNALGLRRIDSICHTNTGCGWFSH